MALHARFDVHLRQAATASVVAVILAACGGGTSGPGDTGGAEAQKMTEIVAAVEALEYECNPESIVMTSAEREVCMTASSVIVTAYTWADVATFGAEVDAEIRCTADSTLGEIRSLRGDTWAIASYSIDGPTSDYAAEIDGLLADLQGTLGGELAVAPCS